MRTLKEIHEDVKQYITNKKKIHELNLLARDAFLEGIISVDTYKSLIF